jgi:hypothetical protein
MAIATWPTSNGHFCMHTILTHSPSSLFKKMAHSVKIQGNNVGYYGILCFHHKKRSTKTQIVTAIGF